MRPSGYLCGAYVHAAGTGAVDSAPARLQESYARSLESFRLLAPLWLPTQPALHCRTCINIRSSSRSACILFGTSGVQARTREKTGSKRTLVAQTHTCEVCFDAVALAGKADNRPCCGGEDMKRERVVGSKRGGSSARTPDAFDVRDHLHR